MNSQKINYQYAQKIIALDEGNQGYLRTDKLKQKAFLLDKVNFTIVNKLIDENNKLNILSKFLFKFKVTVYSLFNFASNYANTALKIAKLVPKPSNDNIDDIHEENDNADSTKHPINIPQNPATNPSNQFQFPLLRQTDEEAHNNFVDSLTRTHL